MIATSYAKLMCSVLLAAAPIFAVISIAVAQQPPSPKDELTILRVEAVCPWVWWALFRDSNSLPSTFRPAR
jgi:hypothetical protein